MNVVRMIKVFGWEKRIDEKIAAKREQELAYQRKMIILEITSNILKYVNPPRVSCGGTNSFIVSLSPSSP